MKTKQVLILALLALCTLHFAVCTSSAQGTAFTYEGQLQNNGSPASGTYNLTVTLYNTNANGAAIAAPVTTNGVIVSNGQFSVTMDFGAAVWNGETNWLEIAVETNGGSSFTTLAPRQQVTPTPYAIFASSTSNLSGTVPATSITGTLANSQLANSSVTVAAGSGLSGGGAVPLGGSTTLANAGVLSVTGNPDITASTTAGAVALGSTATNVNTPGAIVKRDSSGNFAAGTITANLAGNASLASNVASGLNITNAFLTNAVITNSVFSGNGGGLTNLTAAQLVSVGNVGNPVSSDNFFVGPSGSLTNGSAGGLENTAIGYSALSIIGTGSDNTASGYQALSGETTGDYNTANGANALHVNSTGGYNTAYGVSALGESSAGANNTAIGYEALGASMAGSNNIALGYNAGVNLAGGSSNIYIGSVGGNANESNTIRIGSNQSTAYVAGVITGNGGGLTNLNGTGAGFSNLTLTGSLSLPTTTTSGNGVIYLGGNPFISALGGSSLFAGVSAGNLNGGNAENTGLGSSALNQITSGDLNTAVGWDALERNSAGYYNTAVGAQALYATADSNNTAVGYQTLYNNTTGSNNIALGSQAGSNLMTGSSNIYIGNTGGSATENNIIRIGSNQSTAYVAGVITGNGGGLTNLSAAHLTGGPVPYSALSGIAGGASGTVLSNTGSGLAWAASPAGGGGGSGVTSLTGNSDIVVSSTAFH